MPVVPGVREEKIVFFENHNSIWNSNATALGTTTTIVGDLITKTTAARDAFNAHQVAQAAAKAATQAFYDAVTSMAEAGSIVIGQIHVKAKTAGDSVYQLAQIPAPATPESKGAPGIPNSLQVKLGNTGALELKWKNSNATGCVYAIYRAVNGETDFANLGGTSLKKFTDTTVPNATTTIQYRIQAVRPSGTSDWGIFTVNLGGGSSGMLVIEGAPLKAAA